MKKVWTKKSQEQINEIVFAALNQNISYVEKNVLGVPGSFLDTKVFNSDASFLKEAPFMSALLENPNHIGCHTLETSEPFFAGTHEIEKSLLEICAVDILKGESGKYDGYVASGGTEANIQAIWVYRNYYLKEFSAASDDIVIVCSEDSHYSMHKAANLLSLDILKVKVNEDNRAVESLALEETLQKATLAGKKYFIVICNMMTTMFGSVDDIEMISTTLAKKRLEYKIHVDGAYGGFYYPFSNEESSLTFKNEAISSFTLDAHKMAQSPYGTGIFLIRKNLIQYAKTEEASYVEGQDFTLIGSRSGANAIAVWMILSKHGPYGWFEKVYILQKRAQWIVKQLDELGILYYRNLHSNIITIRSSSLNKSIAEKYWLVPDNHVAPRWYKIVVMEHVTVDILNQFIEELKANPKSC